MSITLADQYYIKAIDNYPYNLEESIENLNYALSACSVIKFTIIRQLFCSFSN
ncbi:MAG: hypothetical protein ABFS35_03800 [Bacteroidota bacterium]